MVYRKTYNATEGDVSITDSALAFVKILRVERTDKVYDIYTQDRFDLSTVSLGCVYTDYTGDIRFENSFNNGEKIKVVYEV
jgi:hypothetical protein